MLVMATGLVMATARGQRRQGSLYARGPYGLNNGRDGDWGTGGVVGEGGVVTLASHHTYRSPKQFL